MNKKDLKKLESKIYMGIFLILSYFTGLWIILATAYATLNLPMVA